MIEAKVQPTRQQKLKLLNEKLAAMMSKKKEAVAVALAQKQQKAQKIDQPTETEKKPEGQQTKEEDDNEGKNPKEPKKIKKIKKLDAQKNKLLRKAAGYVWTDKTMQEWNENDYRLFCGNLGNEVTDQILATAFRKYSSFQKAKVVRDKRTSKTRGYGFVSFSNPKDFLACLDEMQGKYVGNRPVRLVKSNWKDRCLDSERNQILPSDFRKNSKKKTNKINTNLIFSGSL